jgi:hypothetical protein
MPSPSWQVVPEGQVLEPPLELDPEPLEPELLEPLDELELDPLELELLLELQG